MAKSSDAGPAADDAEDGAGDRTRTRRVGAGRSGAAVDGASGTAARPAHRTFEAVPGRLAASRRLHRIAALLGVPTTHFHDGAPGTGTGEGAAGRGPSSTDQALRLTRAFARIDDPSVRQRILDLVEDLAGRP